MRRLSPITIGMAVLAAFVLAVGMFLVFRSRAEIDVPAASSVPIDEAVPPPPRAPAPSFAARPEPTPVPNPPPVAVDAVSAAVDSSTVTANIDGPDAVEPAPAIISRRRLVMAAERQKTLQQVDEKLFEALKLSETTRAAIRQVNDDYKRGTQAMLAAGADGGAAKLTAAEQSRRAAIDSLLGADVAKDFHAEEFAATRRLRRQTRQPPSDGVVSPAEVPPGDTAAPSPSPSPD